MIRKLASGWEKTFSRRTKIVLTEFEANAKTLFDSFHNNVDIRARSQGADSAGLQILQQQLSVYNDTFKDLSVSTRKEIDEQQKKVNREFTPVIRSAMIQAYRTCAGEHGVGQFERMKDIMAHHIDQVRKTMFHESTNKVRHQLSNMVRTIREEMKDKAFEVLAAIKQDYRSVLGLTPKWQMEMQKDVKAIIDDADKIFMKAAGMDLEDEKEKKREESDALGDDNPETEREPTDIPSMTVKQDADVTSESSKEALGGDHESSNAGTSSLENASLGLPEPSDPSQV